MYIYTCVYSVAGIVLLYVAARVCMENMHYFRRWLDLVHVSNYVSYYNKTIVSGAY